MKYLLIIILTISLSACCNHSETFFVKESTAIVVLNKKSFTPISRGPVATKTYLYLFDGQQASWYECDNAMYQRHEINDTIRNIVITKTLYKE